MQAVRIQYVLNFLCLTHLSNLILLHFSLKVKGDLPFHLSVLFTGIYILELFYLDMMVCLKISLASSSFSHTDVLIADTIWNSLQDFSIYLSVLVHILLNQPDAHMSEESPLYYDWHHMESLVMSGCWG